MWREETGMSLKREESTKSLGLSEYLKQKRKERAAFSTSTNHTTGSVNKKIPNGASESQHYKEGGQQEIHTDEIHHVSEDYFALPVVLRQDGRCY